jgi:hypothetical protein
VSAVRAISRKLAGGGGGGGVVSKPQLDPPSSGAAPEPAGSSFGSLAGDLPNRGLTSATGWPTKALSGAQRTLDPLGTALSAVSSTGSLPTTAASTMPSDRSPRSTAGARLVTTTTCRPTSAAGS